MMVDQILSNCPGILAVHDDITIYIANSAEHDAALHYLMRESLEQELVCNSAKSFIKQPQISYFGRTFSA